MKDVIQNPEKNLQLQIVFFLLGFFFIIKRSGDLQWRILHCVLATNVFVSKFNLNVLPFFISVIVMKQFFMFSLNVQGWCHFLHCMEGLLEDWVLNLQNTLYLWL